MSILKIKNLNFSYGEKLILDDINMYLDEGEVVALIGSSGAGKTTLFHLIAGLIPSNGEILIQQNELLKIAYMQQNDLLLEHLNICENVALPLIINGVKKNEAYRKTNELLDEFELSELSKKYPKNLSGGQKQRVAFIRTIILKASLYLLDEPFNSLDFFTKNKIYEWFKSIQKSLNLSTLLITHDINEAMALSDRMYLLHDAKIIKELDSKNTNQLEVLSYYQNFQI